MSHLKIAYTQGLRAQVTSEQGQLLFHTDAPKEHGGMGEYLSPTDLFAVSLGACIITIMGIYAKKMGIAFEGVTADVEKKPSPTGGISEIIVHVHYPHSIDSGAKDKLENAAKNCPIHHSIDPKIKQQILFHYA